MVSTDGLPSIRNNVIFKMLIVQCTRQSTQRLRCENWWVNVAQDHVPWQWPPAIQIKQFQELLFSALDLPHRLSSAAPFPLRSEIGGLSIAPSLAEGVTRIKFTPASGRTWRRCRPAAGETVLLTSAGRTAPLVARQLLSS
jgi:hypothetical protein